MVPGETVATSRTRTWPAALRLTGTICKSLIDSSGLIPRGERTPARDLHLHLVADAGLRIGPEVGHGEAAGGGGLRQGPGTSTGVTYTVPAFFRSTSTWIIG